MNFFCGTDIIEISRIKNAIETKKEKFLNKVYTNREIKYCNSKSKSKYQHFAARFAAKEAVYKTISSSINKPINWKEIEILNEDNGKPFVILKTKIENLEKIEISISHCKEYAVANAIAIYKE